MTCRPYPARRAPPDDDLVGRVAYVVAPDAEPADVLPSLARLLIGMARRRRERRGAGQGDGKKTVTVNTKET